MCVRIGMWAVLHTRAGNCSEAITSIRLTRRFPRGTTNVSQATGDVSVANAKCVFRVVRFTRSERSAAITRLESAEALRQRGRHCPVWRFPNDRIGETTMSLTGPVGCRRSCETVSILLRPRSSRAGRRFCAVGSTRPTGADLAFARVAEPITSMPFEGGFVRGTKSH